MKKIMILFNKVLLIIFGGEGGGVLSHKGMCQLKGYIIDFVPFQSENELSDFAHFGLETGMVFKETTKHECIK